MFKFCPGGVQVYTILMYQKEKIERAKRSSKFGSVLGNLDLKIGYLDQVSPPKPEISGLYSKSLKPARKPPTPDLATPLTSPQHRKRHEPLQG